MTRSIPTPPLEARTSKPKAILRQDLSSLPRLLAGRIPDSNGAVRQLFNALGVELLTIIKEAYVIKARGGTDAAGIKWKPLDPKTIAYSRRHPGLSRKRSSAAKKGRSSRPLLSESHDKLWRGVYASALNRGASSSDAAAMAWGIVKARGGRTILSEHGGTQVEILRDTGRLLNSLSPGSRGKDGIFRVAPGNVTVGTNVEYAEKQHRDRPLWPEPQKFPNAWILRLRDALADGLKLILSRGMR